MVIPCVTEQRRNGLRLPVATAIVLMISCYGKICYDSFKLNIPLAVRINVLVVVFFCVFLWGFFFFSAKVSFAVYRLKTPGFALVLPWASS